ncbi:unnamed protein product [Oikopleura dioica]|uniref:Kringle domain-containing protein n=1 Tax=Oikopleura dioica TaxID=34765 RepID=E4WZ28_OIKDI|nr:unnamed protein product [Oikopleura dioica]
MRVFKIFVFFAFAKSDDPSILPDDDSAPAPELTTITIQAPTTTTEPEIEDGECMTAELDYFGEKNETQTGAACRNWTEIQPPLRKIDYFQQKHNHCRNPEINGKRDERGPWCFREVDYAKEIDGIIDNIKSKRKLTKFWDYCFSEEEIKNMKTCKNSKICPGTFSGNGYNESVSGYKCKCWSDVGLSIRPSDENTKTLLKEKYGIEWSFNDNHNNCRNVPQNYGNTTHPVWKFESQPWCYLANDKDIEILGKTWQHCATEPEFCAKPYDLKKDEMSTEECLDF